jgi:hypothetical protein
MFSIQDGLPLGGEDRGGVQDLQVPPAHDQLPEVIPSAASGHAGEGYRFAVDCDLLIATIWSRDLFDASELEGYKLVWELRGEDVEIRPNSMTSKWEDLETLIGKEKILVYTPDGDEVLNPTKIHCCQVPKILFGQSSDKSLATEEKVRPQTSSVRIAWLGLSQLVAIYHSK